MQNKVNKILSIILAFIMILAVCTVGFTVFAEQTYKEYYVSSDGINVTRGNIPETAGTKQNPVKTFADVTFLIERDNLSENDVARVLFTAGQTMGWCIEDPVSPDDRTKTIVPIKHKCKVEIDSTDPSIKPTILNYDHIIFCGDTTVNNVIMNVDYNSDLIFNGYNIVLEEGSEVEIRRACLLPNNANGLDKDVNIVIKGSFMSNYIVLGSGVTKQTINGDINFYIDNPKARAIFKFRTNDKIGAPSDRFFRDEEFADADLGPSILNGDINILVKNAEALNIKPNDNNAIINGDFQILIDDSIKAVYDFKENFNNITTNGGKWLITNMAADDDFIEFSDVSGKLAVKDSQDAYVREFGKDLKIHTGGNIDLTTVSGIYSVSNEEFEEKAENPNKTIYFVCSGGVHRLVSFYNIIPGETYCFEIGLYNNNIEDMNLFAGLGDNGDIGIGAQFENVQKIKKGNYYKVKGEITIPATYHLDHVQIGLYLPPYSEGVWIDRTFYKKGDSTKTDLIRENKNFTSGLDGIRFNYVFWGTRYHTYKGGEALHSWTDGMRILNVMDFDATYIDELIKLSNPNDGKWWKPSDIITEKEELAYGTVKGVFKDSNGKVIKNAKLELVAKQQTYKAVTNSKGEFDFGKVIVGYYDLFVKDGSKQIETGISIFVEKGDEVTVNLVSDISAINAGADYDDTNNDDGIDDEVSEIGGNLSGTVYTPYLDTVSNLKVYLRNVGEVLTDENGNFAFANVPVGEYELYTVLSDNSEYFFRKVNISENQDLSIKLKYDPPKTASGAIGSWVIWVIIAAVVAFVVVTGVVGFIVFKKQKFYK